MPLISRHFLMNLGKDLLFLMKNNLIPILMPFLFTFVCLLLFPRVTTYVRVCVVWGRKGTQVYHKY